MMALWDRMELRLECWIPLFGRVVGQMCRVELMVAGYSVLTYVLGVGDRHLDNLMLAPDGTSTGRSKLIPGHFFHVDFGYILGRDPKPYPPPVKVCKEMVDAMGGTGSSHYARFQSLCYTAFIGLRKNANLILNLFALMVNAGIQDIQLEPDKAVWKVGPFQNT
jgi:phosphatidylinositol 3-kinase